MLFIITAVNTILAVINFIFTITFMCCLQSAEERHTQWTLDPDYFEKKTVHDDEKDHRSQHFRRYGHGATLLNFDETILHFDLCSYYQSL